MHTPCTTAIPLCGVPAAYLMVYIDYDIVYRLDYTFK